MATVSTPKPELDDGIGEEIEVLIEEHERFIDASREESSIPTSGGGADLWNTKDPADTVNHSTVGVEAYKNESEEEGKDICVHKSIDKIITTKKTTKTKKRYFSRASKLIVKSFTLRQKERKASPPPLLILNTTFDTEPSLSLSEEEELERERDSYSTTSGDTDHDVLLDLQPKECSRLSGPHIETIMEEQQQKREQAEDQREQVEIDDLLQPLYDDENCEWFQSEIEHAQIVSEIISEIDHGDDGSHPVTVGDGGNDTVAVTAKTNVVAAAETPPRATQIAFLNENIQFCEELKKSLSTPPLVEKNHVVLWNEDVVGEAEKLMYSPVVLGSEGVVGATLAEEIVITAPPPSPVHKSISLPEDKGLLGFSIGSDIPLDPTKGCLLTPQLLLFEDHPEERAAGPIDLDEVHDHVEQDKEEPPGAPVVASDDLDISSDVAEDKEGVSETLSLIPDDSDLSPGVVEDKEGVSETLSLIPDDSDISPGVAEDKEGFPETLSLIPAASDISSGVAEDKEGVSETLSLIPADSDIGPGVADDKEGFPETLSLILPASPSPKKFSNAETTASSTASSPTSSLSIGEHQYHRRRVQGDFARLKLTMMLAMVCVVFGIGTIGCWFDLSRYSPPSNQAHPRSSIAEPTPIVDEGSSKRNRRAKKKNRR